MHIEKAMKKIFLSLFVLIFLAELPLWSQELNTSIGVEKSKKSQIKPLWSQELNMAIGESVLLSTRPLENLRFQKKGLVSLKDLGSQIILTGKKLGETRLHVGKRIYHIRVLRKNLFESLNQLQRWSKGKRGPKIKVTTDHISIAGRLLSFHDFKDLENFTRENSQFRITAKITDRLQKQIRSYVIQRLQQANLLAGILSFQPHMQLRTGVRNDKQKSRYKKLLRPFGIELILDPEELQQTPVLKIELYIAHLKKSFLRQWGVEWPGKFSANVLPGEATKFDLFTLSLQTLESQGFGQILANPTLITESGKKAEFHSGGEFPIVTSNRFNNNVQWKRYGLSLKVTPKANASKNLKVVLQLELSNIDQSMAINNIPALTQSHLKTEVNMKTPRPILLSGFLRQDFGRNSQGLPWLKQIPILKPLFSNGQIHNSEMELVFILLPEFYEQ